MILNFKTYISESIWSDIQDRSSGEVRRKEDEYDIYKNELERGVEVSVKRYVIQSIYSDYYDGSSDTFLKCIQEWDKNICTNAQLYDRKSSKYIDPSEVLPLYIKKNWETGKSYKSLVEKEISEEEKKVKDTGFIKKPGESISDTLSKWFDENFEELEQDFSDEIEEHNAEYHNEGGSKTTELGVDEWWDDLKYIEQVEIYQEYMKKTNESIWSDIQDRSAGDTVRKEDEMTQDDLDAVDDFIFGFATRVVWDGVRDSLTNFLKYIDENPEALDCDINRVKKYVENNWHKSICDDVEAAIEQEDKEKEQDMNESIWSDIQDRSSGDVVRKEDDVNLLDLNEFYTYIKDQYKTKVEYIDLDAMGDGNGDVLGVDITENIILFYKPKRGHILLSWSRVKIPMPFFDELTDRFKVESPSAMRRIITEQDGSCTNKTFVNVIEFFLEHKESMMNESIWSDIQDRSSGDVIRKEDDVNLLDKDGLYEYLISHYKPVEGIDIKSYIFCGNSYINLCVFTYPTETRYSILLDILNCRVKVRTPYIKRWPANLLDMIYKKYNREDIVDENRDHMTFITPKEGKGNNQFYIDFLDMILNNVDKPLLKKVINESIWSDIQDRSAGETIRKEDERHKILERLLATYIKLFAESCYYHDEYTSGSYPDFRAYIKDFRDNPRIEEVCPDDSYFDDLLNYVNKETWNDQIIDTVMEMTNRLDKGEHHLITDDVIEELRKHNVNESIWSDIQDRSSGDIVRKEDEMTSDDFLMLRETAKMFLVGVRNYSVPKNRKYAPRRIDGQEGFIDYILERKKEHFWSDTPDETYDKVIKFVKDNWGDCTGIQDFMDKYLSNINECDGVPGGLTPADVGGMGAAYFPGPNGEPGSGDLPSPTGIVYHQVAPYTMFLKDIKKKKKKKKFRIEDEPCAHSKNSKTYDYVDDFREYVDRTYNNIDKRK